MKKLFLALILAIPLACTSKPVPVIFDTDMGNDIDDALALAMLYRYADEGKVDLLGICSSKTDSTSVKYVDILNHWYGYPSVPIGRLTGAEQYERLNPYTQKILDSGLWKGEERTDSSFPESWELMRDLLKGQKDNSSVIVAVGFFTNLSRLLAAEPELVKRKVRLLVLMAGDFEGPERMAEHNVRFDIEATRHICSQWPSPIIFSPFKVGVDVEYPVDAILENLRYDEPNPVAEAYKVYKRMPYDRPTWDLSAVLIAVEDGWGFSFSPNGTVTVDEEGRTWFEASENGKHRYAAVPAENVEKVKERYLELTYAK